MNLYIMISLNILLFSHHEMVKKKFLICFSCNLSCSQCFYNFPTFSYPCLLQTMATVASESLHEHFSVSSILPKTTSCNPSDATKLLETGFLVLLTELWTSLEHPCLAVFELSIIPLFCSKILLIFFPQSAAMP